MEENIKVRWLTDHEQTKIAPKTLITQVLNENGSRFKDSFDATIAEMNESVEAGNRQIRDHANNTGIHVTQEEKETWNNIEVPSLEGYATEEYVSARYEELKIGKTLGFYCVEDVTIVINGVSTTYPANSTVEVLLSDTDVWEIIPTSDNSILSLTSFPGALDTFYPWLEGVAQFSNILFDMNAEEFYSKWSQGNQGAYRVQFAQYTNCIFWSDNPYISDVAKRTNYTLCSTSELPLCYSTIPDNTFKSFYLAFGVNSDPNWSNPIYKESFAKATWATQVFSYYGARVIGFPGHDNPDFLITLPKDCRGLMFDARNIECAGTFDADNVTNFGAKSGSWREAFGDCPSLRRLYIKNLKVNLNISWSPIDYDSISYIISSAANTSKITISVSPYTYNLLSESDFELATSKNITIALITTNYVEDKRLGAIANKADISYVDTKVADLVNSAPETLDTLGELAAALQENDEVVEVLNGAITNKADKTYVDELVANIPTDSEVFIVDCPDGTIISHTFEQIMEAINSGKAVYATLYDSSIMPLTFISRDGEIVEYIEFNNIGSEVPEDQFGFAWAEGITIFNDNTFHIKHCDLLTQRHPDIESPDGEKDIVANINRLIEKSELAETKKDKDLIITYLNGSHYYATHYVTDVVDAVNAGRTVYFQKDGELLHLLEVTPDFATFYIFYMNINNKIQQKVVAISGNDIILEQDDIYDFATKDGLKNYYLKTEIDKKLADLVDGAPETLDTLGKLAAAFKENDDVVDVLNQAIGTKADKTDILLKSEQELTKDEQLQVRKNLQFIGMDVSGKTFNIDGTDVVASQNAEIFGDYENNIAVGQWSIAEGCTTLAKGRVSHAEGAFTKALNDGCHVEGYGTEASGYWSHAEGEYTKVTSYASHAEGSYTKMPDGSTRYTTASGYASHAEGGGCHTSGVAAHAEGIGTTASGRCSHVEGTYTVAAGKAQHAEGIANIPDTEDKYIHIAGNGTTPADTSNAHTLDWDGNAWFSGDVYVGSTSGINRDEGSKKLATEEFVLNNAATDALLTTEQELTEEELLQVRNNIKFIGKAVGGTEVIPYTIEELDYGTDTHRIEETPSEPVVAGEGAEVFNVYDGMNVASGAYATAMGHHTVASGDYSFTNGRWTTASGLASKASGLLAYATGHYSNAEGTRTRATKNNAHAEGDSTQANGNAAHSEGLETIASTNCAHAEGWKTKANGIASHAEGEGTIAAGRGQTAMGRWNVSDTSSKLLVGIGTSDTARKNGFKVSSTGQGYFASDVYANDSKKLATEEFVTQKVAEINIEAPVEYDAIILKSSTEGSSKKFRLTIGDDGVLSAEEVV